MKMLDLLIANIDRNQGNLSTTSDWHLLLIDHSRAFISKKDLKGMAELGSVDRALWTKMQALTFDTPEGRTRRVGERQRAQSHDHPPRPDGEGHRAARDEEGRRQRLFLNRETSLACRPRRSSWLRRSWRRTKRRAWSRSATSTVASRASPPSSKTPA